MKAAIVQRAWENSPFFKEMDMKLIHTGQHYDNNLSGNFFNELKLNKPDYNLAVGSGNITNQIAMILKRLDPIYKQEKPDAIVVYGDTNSTIGGSLAAAHMNIPVIHVEAGERIFLRNNQPEEINRVVTDCLTSLCLCASHKAVSCLKDEGVKDHRVKFVGDPMYDLFLWATNQLENRLQMLLDQFDIENNEFVLSTIHRSENTDCKNRLINLLDNLDKSNLPVILPLHPRTKNAIEKIGWKSKGSLKFVDPMGYLDVIALLLACKYTVTDSGGISRESFWAKKPSIVPMSNTPWTEIEQSGWMSVIKPEGNLLSDMMNRMSIPDNFPEGMFGDGKAGQKIISSIYDFIKNPTSPNLIWR